ncbi:conserved hypothetical protein [Candidatus Brocadia pituitae]|nr:conserved hypothetical protein [Candidatus Brocadia pituitae]
MSHVKSFFRIGRTYASWSWPARLMAIGCILVALYAGIGFLLLPPLIKSRLVKAIADRTGRHVELGELQVNPFALSTTMQKFEMQERDGNRFIGFDELYVNFQVSSLFRRTYTFAQLYLTAPYVCIKILKDKTFNFQDLLAVNKEKSTRQQGTMVPLLIQQLIVDRGQTIFEDHSRTTPLKAQINAVSFSLKNFTTQPNREGLYEFEATTDQGEALKYRGNISMSPRYSKGSLELSGIKLRGLLWSYLQEQLNFEIAGGELDISGNYEFDGTGEKPRMLVQNGNINVRSLTVVQKDDKEEVISLPSLTMSGADIDYEKRQLTVARIQSNSSKISGRRNADGSISLLTMFQPKSIEGSGEVQSQKQEKSNIWHVAIGTIEIADYAFHMEDRSTKPTAHLEVSPLNMKLEDVQIGAPGSAHIELQAGLNQTGTIRVAGKVAFDSLASELDMQLSKVALRPFQPYVNQFAKLVIEDGAVSMDGHVSYSPSAGSSGIGFLGNIAIESARVTDPVLEEDILRCERLNFEEVKYQNNPDLLSMKEIVARGLYTRIIVGPDRTTNIQQILVKDDQAPVNQGSQQTGGTQLPIRIDQVSVIDSSMNFADLSLTPRFATGIQNLNGTVKGLSSEQLARADIDLKGQVDKYAPVFIQGKINPLSDQAFTDIVMNFQGIDLTTFSPYSGRFAGYKIEKGKLTLELHYKLSEKILIGENHVVMDQFTLGERVEGPDATKLPVRLAIAILKDSRGVIDINLPVRGDLNDPEFSLAPLILKAFVGLIVKAATAPFKMLGALVGGEGEELGFISFAPGSSSLSQEQQEKLAKLAKALGNRPQLTLDLRGTAVEVADRLALAERAVMARVRVQATTPSEGTLTEDEQKRLLKLYRETFKKEDPRDLVSPTDEKGAKLPRDVYKTAVAEASRRRLVENYPISDDDLRILAHERAASVKDYMIHLGSIGEPRIFLLDADIKATASNGEIRMPLTLNAR